MTSASILFLGFSPGKPKTLSSQKRLSMDKADLGAHLQLQTVALSQIPELINHLPQQASVFIRNGQGLVGFGEAVRITATGPSRMQQLADSWRELVARTQVEDSVGVPGTGLVAFGSFSFADDSSAESVLLVPKVVLGVRDDKAWVTSIVGEPLEDFWSKEIIYSEESSIQLSEGLQSADGFKNSVREALDAIHSEKVEKIVLARDLVSKVSENFDIRNAIRRLAVGYPTCWTYSVDGLFGASPELLVRVSHRQVSARVLAGTAGRGTDPIVDQAISSALVESHKNFAEHKFAVASLVEELKKFCTKVDADEKPFSLQLPNLWHLASDVHAVLHDDASVLDLAAVLHPTAAVAGTPTLTARKLIGELEPFDRGRYAGPVGWIGADGDGEWAIALRGACLSEGQITAYAGCGIVAGSEPQAELDETELKFKPIREALS